MTEQMALNLPARVDFSVESFVQSPANADAVAALERWRAWPRAAMALVGPAGAGKSHLGSIWAHNVRARITTGPQLADALSQLSAGQCLLVEDIDPMVPEDALFHAINRAAQGDIRALLLTARRPPVLWEVGLADLVSRLRALPHVELHEPDDAVLSQLLHKQFHDRGAPVRAGVIEYLLPRMERSVSSIRDLVERMDKLALARRTPITRAVARAVLELPDDELPNDEDPTS